jgi:hypothetical protein
MADRNAPAPDPGKPAALTVEGRSPPAEFKVAEIREDGTVILELGDGRMFPATVAEGVEGVHKRGTVLVKADGLNDDKTPIGPVITKVV